MTEPLSHDDLVGYLEEMLEGPDQIRVRDVLACDPAARDALDAEMAMMEDVSNALFDTLSGQFPAAGQLRFEPIAEAMARPERPVQHTTHLRFAPYLRVAWAALVLIMVGVATWQFSKPSQAPLTQRVAAAVSDALWVPPPDTPREDQQPTRALELLPEGWALRAEDPIRRPFEAGVDRIAKTFVVQARQREGRAWVRQTVDARERYRGTRVRFAAALRTLASDDDARLCVWLDERMVACDEVRSQPRFPTDAWHQGEVVVDVPMDAKTFAFGVVIAGQGVEFKDLVFGTVDPATSPTTLQPSRKRSLPTEPMNLAP